jgi:hypothetical protein
MIHTSIFRKLAAADSAMPIAALHAGSVCTVCVKRYYAAITKAQASMAYAGNVVDIQVLSLHNSTEA